MAVPKQKISSSRRGMRRSSKMRLNGNMVVENSVTGEFHRPHHVSPDGYYAGRQVTTDKVNL